MLNSYLVRFDTWSDVRVVCLFCAECWRSFKWNVSSKSKLGVLLGNKAALVIFSSGGSYFGYCGLDGGCIGVF